MFLNSEKKSRLIYFSLFVAGAVSIFPWTAVIAEMLGLFALLGVILMVLFFLGGYAILKGWRKSTVLAFFGPTPTILLFGVMTGGLFRGDEKPQMDQLAMLALPLLLGMVCLLAAVRYCAEYFYAE